MNEEMKTSLLIIATIFSTAGAVALTTDVVKGSILLGIAITVLIVRGILKKKGLIAETPSQ